MSEYTIHPAAAVDPAARIGSCVRIGPQCTVGPDVVLGDRCVLHCNATIIGRTVCGKNNEFYPGSVIGAEPQDLKYKGGDTRVEIGDGNVFREQVTVHAGTEVAAGVTRVGSDNRFLVGSHLAHDVIVGNGCILSNYVQLAGHVVLEDRVAMGGLSAVHHFTTIGRYAYIGGLTRIVSDVAPCMIVEGNPSRVRGYNETGMRRWGIADEEIRGVREAYRILFGPRSDSYGASMQDRLVHLESQADLNGEVRYLCESVRRSLDEGVYGRQLESNRRDRESERKDFYNQSADGEEES